MAVNLRTRVFLNNVSQSTGYDEPYSLPFVWCVYILCSKTVRTLERVLFLPVFVLRSSRYFDLEVRPSKT